MSRATSLRFFPKLDGESFYPLRKCIEVHIHFIATKFWMLMDINMIFIWRKIILHSQRNSHCLVLHMERYCIFFGLQEYKILQFLIIESLSIHQLKEVFVPIATVLTVESQIEFQTYQRINQNLHLLRNPRHAKTTQ